MSTEDRLSLSSLLQQSDIDLKNAELHLAQLKMTLRKTECSDKFTPEMKKASLQKMKSLLKQVRQDMENLRLIKSSLPIPKRAQLSVVK